MDGCMLNMIHIPLQNILYCRKEISKIKLEKDQLLSHRLTMLISRHLGTVTRDFKATLTTEVEGNPEVQWNLGEQRILEK